MGEVEVTQPCWDVQSRSKVRAALAASSSHHQGDSAAARRYKGCSASCGPARELLYRCNQVQPAWLTAEVKNNITINNNG